MQFFGHINIPGVALAKPIELSPSMTDGGVETLYEGIRWSEQDMTALENAPKWNDDKSIKLWTLSIMPAGGSDDSIDILMGQFYRVGEGISEIGLHLQGYGDLHTGNAHRDSTERSACPNLGKPSQRRCLSCAQRLDYHTSG